MALDYWAIQPDFFIYWLDGSVELFISFLVYGRECRAGFYTDDYNTFPSVALYYINTNEV